MSPHGQGGEARAAHSNRKDWLPIRIRGSQSIRGAPSESGVTQGARTGDRSDAFYRISESPGRER